MRIDTKLSLLPKEKTVSRRSSPNAEKGAEVVVAKSIQSTLDASAAKDADRASRLAHIKEQIDTGEYRIDYESLAKRILQEEAAMRAE
jgi:anti-sigma28 factor (negative regulator of flagellin synthesis)